MYTVGQKLKAVDFNENLVNWLNSTQHYLEDINEGLYIYQIAKHIPNEDYILDGLRYRRERECFSVINRGQLWYDRLTEAQKSELNAWYQAWLDVTETKVVPTTPTWL